MEELFSRPEIVKKKGKEEEKQEKKSSIVTLLDPKSSLNVNIFLKQFKMPNAKIIAIFSEGDCSRITSDQLKAVQKLLPDKNTIDLIKSYDGDIAKLGTAEDFFRQLILLKQYPLRIEAMQIKLDFGDKLGELKPAIQTLKLGMEEVLNCSSYKMSATSL